VGKVYWLSTTNNLEFHDGFSIDNITAASSIFLKPSWISKIVGIQNLTNLNTNQMQKSLKKLFLEQPF
jgi:hypothetical protein